MTILVELDDSKRKKHGKWIVRNGPGAAILSRHRKKKNAMKEARKEARKRDGADIRVQRTDGTWRRP